MFIYVDVDTGAGSLRDGNGIAFNECILGDYANKLRSYLLICPTALSLDSSSPPFPGESVTVSQINADNQLLRWQVSIFGWQKSLLHQKETKRNRIYDCKLMSVFLCVIRQLRGDSKGMWVLETVSIFPVFRNPAEMSHTCRGTISLHGALIHTVDACTFVVSNGGTQTFHIKASTEVERQQWVTALELAKAKAIQAMESGLYLIIICTSFNTSIFPLCILSSS